MKFNFCTKKYKKNVQKHLQCTEITKYKPSSFQLYAISLNNTIWKSGDVGTITISFGHIKEPGVSPHSAWSHIGKQCDKQYPSMNLGFIDPPLLPFEFNGMRYYPDKDAVRNYYIDNSNLNWVPGGTVIHEFCHALGLLHEHQNTINGNKLKLNIKEIVKYYKEIGMDETSAYSNVIDTYNNKEIYEGSDFDPDSIMLYYLPDKWIDGPNPTKPNFTLSVKDIEHLKKLYPLDSPEYPVLNIEFIDDYCPEWKIAWVNKIVIETFTPIIGVRFNFPPLERSLYNISSKKSVISRLKSCVLSIFL